MNQYDQRIASSCAISGCNLQNPQTPAEQALADDLNGMRQSAERRERIGFARVVVVLVVRNHPQRHVLKLDLVPAQGGATATVGWRF